MTTQKNIVDKKDEKKRVRGQKMIVNFEENQNPKNEDKIQSIEQRWK